MSTDGNFSVETHVLNENIEGASDVAVCFIKRLRDNRKFESLGELKRQIYIDIKQAMEFVGVCDLYVVGDATPQRSEP